jgi:hypothetical protein
MECADSEEVWFNKKSKKNAAKANGTSFFMTRILVTNIRPECLSNSCVCHVVTCFRSFIILASLNINIIISISNRDLANKRFILSRSNILIYLINLYFEL